MAASKDDFQSSLGCGVCLEVTGSGIPAAADLDGAPPVKGTLNAIVVDQDDTLSQGMLKTHLRPFSLKVLYGSTMKPLVNDHLGLKSQTTRMFILIQSNPVHPLNTDIPLQRTAFLISAETLY